MTGFQKYHFPHEENVKNISETLGRGNKLLYLSKRLTGALDSYKEQRQVSMLSSLRKFRTVFDCKRMVINNQDTMKDTKPYLNIDDATFGRALMNALRSGIYSALYRDSIFVTSKDSKTEALKYFLRRVLVHYNYIISEKQLESLIDVIPEFKVSIILRYMAQILLEKGVILNKLNKFRASEK